MDRLWTHSMKHYRCTNLNYVKSLFTDDYSEKTTYSWLSGVSPYRYVRQEQRRYLDSKINGVNPTKNGIYCLNVSFFTRFRRLISNFCIKFYLNVYICKVTQNFIIYEGSIGSPRYTGTATSIEELLEEAISVVGEEKINLKQKGKHI